MNILIFGATGGTGRELVAQGLKLGHHISAFVRDPTKLQITDSNLSVVQGDAQNFADVDRAVKGQDVVISVLGNKTSDALRRVNTTISSSVKNIIGAMDKNRTKRLLFVASFGVNKRIFWPEKIVIKTLIKNLFVDIPKQEDLIKHSDLNYTLVHPARLVDTGWTGVYKSGENLPIGLFSKISRADVADYLLKNVQNGDLIGKTITISY